MAQVNAEPVKDEMKNNKNAKIESMFPNKDA